MFEIVEDLTELETTTSSRSRPKRIEHNFVGYEEVEDVVLLDCIHCGSCVDPDTCVWSVVCPKCNSGPSQLCKEGSRLVGLHEERWELAKGTELAWR